MRAIAGGLAFVAGCFNPSYQNPRCGPEGECPNGLKCVAEVCRTDGEMSDAGGSGDAVPDGPAMPTVEFMAASSAVSEAGGSASLQVMLSGAFDREVTVPFTLDVGTATSADFSLATSPLVFAPGVTRMPVDVTITNDNLFEDDETVVVKLGSPTNANLGASVTHRLSLANDDSAPTISFSLGSASVVEGNSGTTPVSVNIVLSSASGKTTTVDFGVGGTATATTDFALATTSPVTLVPGTTQRAVIINVVGDNANETNQTVILTLANPINAVIANPASYTLTIQNDD